jgi:hypothetical protein
MARVKVSHLSLKGFSDKRFHLSLSRGKLRLTEGL